ncbi:hypothetical protein [Paenibacillus alginolyticus]|nr:hypothetical protein [Paenibacillus alginolyticus]MEC0144327.1 hypothetical protein [Paenibacillus alginolyticus]
MTNIVEVKGLTKSYGQVTAVDHVSFVSVKYSPHLISHQSMRK